MPFQVGTEVAAGLKIGTERVGGVKIGTDVVFRTLPFGNLGRLPFQEGVHQFVVTGLGVAGDGHLYAWNNETNARFKGLWRINPRNPSDTSGDFGRVSGTFPSGGGRDISHMTLLDSTFNARIDGNLLVFDRDSRAFWRFDPSDLSNSGRLHSIDTNVDTLTIAATDLFYFSQEEAVWIWNTSRGTSINPRNQSRLLGIWVAAEWYDGDLIVVQTNPQPLLKRVDVNNARSEVSPYGSLGNLPSNVIVTDMAFHEGNLIVTNSSDNSLWHIDPTNPGRTG